MVENEEVIEDEDEDDEVVELEDEDEEAVEEEEVVEDENEKAVVDEEVVEDEDEGGEKPRLQRVKDRTILVTDGMSVVCWGRGCSAQERGWRGEVREEGCGKEEGAQRG